MNRPVLIGIAGGSGAGKTRLSGRIANAFPTQVTRVSLDDFYFDRSRLTPPARLEINYDHPSAIEWTLLRNFLTDYRSGGKPRLPKYDFATHCRASNWVECELKPILVVEGLWVLSRRYIRDAFDFAIYLDCPEGTRFERRLARDVTERGRRADEVREQFHATVAPMHELHVTPQRRWATLVLNHPISDADVELVIRRLRGLHQELPRRATSRLCVADGEDRRKTRLAA
jgi:uridine kinase